MPVPKVTRIMLLYPWPPPCQYSPRAATLASFPAFTGRPSRADSVSSSRKVPHPRLAHRSTTPFRRTGPGTPMPRPSTCSLDKPRRTRQTSTASTMSGRIAPPWSSVRVGISHFSKSSPGSVNNPSFTVVPPTSIPKPYLISNPSISSQAHILSGLTLYIYAILATVFPILS